MLKNKSTHIVVTFVTIFAVRGAMAADKIFASNLQSPTTQGL